MAGNPRRRLKRFEAIDSRLTDVLVDFEALMPDAYLDPSHGRDPLAVAWRSAAEASLECSDAMDTLEILLAAKVGPLGSDVDSAGDKSAEAAESSDTPESTELPPTPEPAAAQAPSTEATT